MIMMIIKKFIVYHFNSLEKIMNTCMLRCECVHFKLGFFPVCVCVCVCVSECMQKTGRAMSYQFV